MKKSIALYLIFGLLITACTDMHVLAPLSPQGEKGERGASAYEVWLSHLDMGLYPDWKGGRSEIDYMKFLSGPTGKKGLDAYEVWKELIADGSVQDPHNPGNFWPPHKDSVRDFFWFLTGERGAKGESGDKGPKGESGDQGVKGDSGDKGPKGESGDKGPKGEPGDKGPKGEPGDKGVKGEPGDKGPKGEPGDKGPKGEPGTPGSDGAAGSDGLTAYQIWKNEAVKGTLPNPHPDLDGYKGVYWPSDKVAETDFRIYLKGADAMPIPKQSSLKVSGKNINAFPQLTDPTKVQILVAVADTMYITITDPEGEPTIRVADAGKLPTTYQIVAQGKTLENGVEVYTFRLTVPHNIGPDRPFELLINNVFKDESIYRMSMNHKGYLTPLEYITEYNLDKSGEAFAATHANAASGLFKLADAKAKYQFSSRFMIDGTHYYMPDIATWRSILPKGDGALKFKGGTTRIDNEAENIRLNTTLINNTFTADYRSTANIAYGLRLKSADNRMRTAFRYEYIDNPNRDADRSLPFDKAMKVTSRYIGPDLEAAAPVTIDEVSTEAFWSQNNADDVVRIFPASGVLDGNGNFVARKFGESGYYWSTNQNSIGGARMLFHQYAADASSKVNPSNYAAAIRLFRKI